MLPVTSRVILRLQRRAPPSVLPSASNFYGFEWICMSGKPGYPLPPGAAAETISAEEVREQLQRILTSSPFLNARRASQFLRFVVEGTLAGEDGFKEYLIGIEVFERPEDNDPKMIQWCGLRPGAAQEAGGVLRWTGGKRSDPH